VTVSDIEKHDMPASYLLHKQLRSGSHTYNSNVIAVSIIRVIIVVAIWSILLAKVSSVTPIAIAIVVLIAYALIEAYSVIRSIRMANWAMEMVEREWRNEF